jgi:hypothetical protein
MNTETKTQPAAKMVDLAKDLKITFPRSPKESLGGYVIAARTLDKCRAALAGTADEYHFNCGLDQMFFKFSGIQAEAFREFVATGADDAEVAAWIREQTVHQERGEVVAWNFKMRDMRMTDMPSDIQVYMEDEYWPEYINGHYPHFFFDIYDIEEGRI